MIQGKTIFIAALDWGLGHATRCVPIIRQLEKENKVIIGVTESTKKIFETEFPNLQKVEIPAYNIRYSGVLPLWLKLLLQLPTILKTIKKERRFVENKILEHHINLVISDSRFGFRSDKCKSVFITHQVFLRAPFLNVFLQKINKRFIKKFDEVWIPDYEKNEESLASDLCHGEQYHQNAKYIKPLSRLTKIELPQKYDVLFLLSGPEPQQSILGKKLIEIAQQKQNIKFAVVANSFQNASFKNMECFVAPSAQQLSEIICSSKKIICRSGYSTLMDIHLLAKNKKDITLVPTPGQTEQEYLADLWSKKFSCKAVNQNQVTEQLIKEF